MNFIRDINPKIIFIRDFLSDGEAAHLIALAEPNLAHSRVVDAETEEPVVHSGRTSRGTFLQRGLDPTLSAIEKRIAELTNTPVQNGESMQILHYEVGGEYKPHFDTFDEATEGGRSCLARGGQRLFTVILYLNTPEEGGETIFPDLDLKVEAELGSALFFESCDSTGQPHPLSLHGGAPVTKGEKWIATKWLREHAFK